MNSTREKSQATIKLNIQIVWNWNSKIQGLKTKKQTKRVWVPKLKCQNKTEKNIIKNTTIKSIKQKNEKIEEKKQFESHTSHNSLSSIPYRSNDWSWNRTGIETIFSLSGNQLIQMSFSTLSFSPPERRCNQHGLCHALSIKQHPSILCLQWPAPPPEPLPNP